AISAPRRPTTTWSAWASTRSASRPSPSVKSARPSPARARRTGRRTAATSSTRPPTASPARYNPGVDSALFARAQMGVSLGFHIVFACIGIAMPVLMVAAEVLWRRTGDEDYLRLARTWGKGTAVFFAVGAVSGTVLSFELGLLFPGFMRVAGPIVGIPFSLEGFAFFTEAIFLGIYLYGWDRVRPALHIAAGIVVALSGLLSAVFVTLVNAWMNAPRGFRVDGGQLVDIDPLRAMTTPFALHEIV